MRLSTSLVVLVVATSVAAPDRSAAAAEHAWSVTALGGFGRFSDRLRIPSDSLADAPLFGARLRHVLNEYWSVEVAGAHASTHGLRADGFEGPDVSVLHASGTLLYTLVEGRYGAPYVGAGGGYIRYEADAGGERHFGTFEVALGWNGRFNDHVGLRLEARNILSLPQKNLESANRADQQFWGGLTLAWGGRSEDRDGDGVPDRIDREPNTPKGARVNPFGVAIDSDGDGVPDGIDRSTSTPRGALVDQWGTPSDADHDGVYDGLDTCPDTPAGVQVDASGCPKDGDGDGVFDGIDPCPDTRKGCVIDSTGCPKDSDGDGVCDGLDRCPDTSPGLTVDATGCPVEVLEHIEVILDAGRFQQRVNFETGKADLPAESLDSLDVVGQLLLAWPALQLEVGGYTDSRGSAAANQLLSERRAQAVKDYLVVKYPGLKEGQLSAKGSGATKPVAPNTSARNMAKNRRVEFVVLNRDVLKKEVERRRLLKAGETPPPTPAPPDTTRK